MAAIAFISYWQLYRQPFSRTSFLAEDINKRLAIIQIVVIVCNSKQRKTKKLGFWPIWPIFNQFITQNINTAHKRIYSSHTQYYWNCKHGTVKANVFCASPGIHLLSIFGALGQKVELLLSIFCGTKITLDSPCLPPHF